MTPVDPQLARNLRPTRLLDLARSCSRDDFSQEIEHPLLLVPTDNPASELSRALEESDGLNGVRVEPATGAKTTVGSLTTLRDVDFSAWDARAPFNARTLRARLARTIHFALPLRKRPDPGRGGSARITVGRTRESDLFLPQGTVSKLHAWFECDDNDRFYVADAGSRNGTRLNGLAIARHAPTSIQSGDNLRFGTVTATVCMPGVLWDALLGDAGAPDSRRITRP